MVNFRLIGAPRNKTKNTRFIGLAYELIYAFKSMNEITFLKKVKRKNLGSYAIYSILHLEFNKFLLFSLNSKKTKPHERKNRLVCNVIF